MKVRRLALTFAAASFIAAPLAVAEGEDQLAKSTTQQIQERKLSSLAPSHRKVLQGKQNSRSRQERGNMYVFADPKGSQTFTNIPEKYNRKKGYKQVEVEKVKFEPIKVASKYSRRSTPQAYKSSEYAELIAESASRYGLDEDLIYAVIRMESAFNPLAVSSAGARGLMQLMPGTAAEMGVTDIFDAAQNIDGGAQYLAKMMGIFNNPEWALAAYNAGPERVRQYNGVPPFTETQNYVRKVMNFWASLKGGGVNRDSLLREASKKIRTASFRPAAPAASAKLFTVHFHSGLTQPADSVEEKDPYYIIEYNKRLYTVRKELVKRIAEPA